MTSPTKMSDEALTYTIKDLMEVIEAQVVAWDGHGRDVTRGALKAAFDRVADATNWKNPIRKVICEEQLELTAYAVEFFTGSKLMVKQDLGFGRVLVEAVGYYAAVGA